MKSTKIHFFFSKNAFSLQIVPESGAGQKKINEK